jgi:uncharacterized coiled-coil DUF342 family protein
MAVHIQGDEHDPQMQADATKQHFRQVNEHSVWIGEAKKRLDDYANATDSHDETLYEHGAAIHDIRERLGKIEESVHEVQRMHASIMETLKASAQRIQGVEQGQVLLQAGQQQRRAKGIRITLE